jgi:hypothetical protein
VRSISLCGFCREDKKEQEFERSGNEKWDLGRRLVAERKRRRKLRQMLGKRKRNGGAKKRGVRQEIAKGMGGGRGRTEGILVAKKGGGGHGREEYATGLSGRTGRTSTGAGTEWYVVQGDDTEMKELMFQRG